MTGYRGPHLAPVQPLEWMDDAACTTTDPDLFFPEKGGSTRNPQKICATCDVATECLLYALTQNERFGIWGGITERGRRKMRGAA